MDDRQALLAAILAAPDDDLPRLVFADWLDENGEGEYAAFIREQIAHASVPEWDPLRIRAEHLNPQRHDAYKSPLPDLPAPVEWHSRDVFRRGFPSVVTVWKGAAFADRLPEVFRLAPVNSIEWWMSGPNDSTLPHWATLTDHPGFRRIRSLALPLVTLTDDNVGRLCDSPHADGLVDLDLSTNKLTPSQVGMLLARFNQLESLALSVVDGPAGDLLAAAAGFAGRRLRRVRFLHTHLERSSFLWEPGFLDSPLFRGLRELDLFSNPFGPGDTGVLARSGALDGLESLNLICRGGDEMAEAIAGHAGLSRLGRLVLDNNEIGPAGAKALAASPALANLRILKLLDNPIGDDGLIALARSPHLSNLLVLDLVFCGIGDAGVETLLASPLADTLVSLRMTLVGHGGVRKDNITPAMESRLRDRFAGRLG